jgi:hypothetical protein
MKDTALLYIILGTVSNREPMDPMTDPRSMEL